jgi:hypothetical protein
VLFFAKKRFEIPRTVIDVQDFDAAGDRSIKNKIIFETSNQKGADSLQSRVFEFPVRAQSRIRRK